MGHNFVSGLSTLKPEKKLKSFPKKPIFFSPDVNRIHEGIYSKCNVDRKSTRDKIAGSRQENNPSNTRLRSHPSLAPVLGNNLFLV